MTGEAAGDGGEPLSDEGAHERFVLLFSKERRRIYGFTYSLVPNAADAEDIFQQVSLLLWRKFDEFDPDRDFFRWACGIVYFTVQNHRRRMKRNRLLFDDALVQHLADERIAWSETEPERNEALNECLSHLGEEDRGLLADIYGASLSPKEVAGKLGRSLHTIYNRLSIIRKRLLECVNRKMLSRRPAGGSASS